MSVIVFYYKHMVLSEITKDTKVKPIIWGENYNFKRGRFAISSNHRLSDMQTNGC